MKIAYCTPALYMAGGVERVLSMKASHMAERYGHDVTIILTDGAGKPFYYPLSPKVKTINLDIGFEELWTCSFAKRVTVYLRKQRRYRRALASTLMELRPDVTVSLLRREINFICDIRDGSKKVGELHVNRANYRNFEAGDSNVVKRAFAAWWMNSLVRQLRRLDRFVVLTHEDRAAWSELRNVTVIPNPLTVQPVAASDQSSKRVISVGRYAYQKGFDILLTAWSMIEKSHPDWSLDIYGDGDRQPYETLAASLRVDPARCRLHPATKDIGRAYADASLYVMSSRFEGFGLVLVEAMAHGLPVVSFDCPCGPKDIVTPGSGVLVPRGDTAALARSLATLMDDEPHRRSMSATALKRAADFAVERIGEQWNNLFIGLCGTQ